MDQAANLFQETRKRKDNDNEIFGKMLLVSLEKLKAKTSKSIQNSRFSSFCLKHSVDKLAIPSNFSEINSFLQQHHYQHQ